MTTKTENEVPENDVDHKAPPSKSECYDLPATYVLDQICETLKDSIRSSQKHLFPQFRGVSGPMTQEWRIWTSASTPLSILLVLSTFLCMGGGWLVFLYLSPPSICSYLSGLLLFMLFSFRFFHSLSLFSFFCCFAVRKKRRKKKENKTNEKWQTTKNKETKSGR